MMRNCNKDYILSTKEPKQKKQLVKKFTFLAGYLALKIRQFFAS